MTKLFKLSAGFARRENIPVYFVGEVLIETAKAVYIYGRGTTETRRTGKCAICGKALTHPVSVLLGVGPICGSHWYDWDSVGGYTEENLARLKGLVEKIQVDQWMPKACVLEMSETEETVEVPPDHPKLKKQGPREGGKAPAPQERKASKITFQNSGKPGIKIVFPVDKEDLDRVRSLTGRRFHGESNPKFWTCPLSKGALESLKEWGFELDKSLEEWLEGVSRTVGDLAPITDIPGLKGTLMPFQAKGVAWIEAKNGRALIADDMGLGKTVQALAWLQLHPELRPAVIVCPASLKINWRNEIMNWMTDASPEIISGTKPYPTTGDILIINYDILPNEYVTKMCEDGKKRKFEKPRTGWVDYILDRNPQVVIADEAHYVKESKTNRTKGVAKMAGKVPNFIPMTGTPAKSRPKELFSPVSMIDPSVLGNYISFGIRFCDGKNNGFGWDFSGASNLAELNTLLTSTVMIRRTKAEVLTELPDKTRSYIPFELANYNDYTKAEKDFLGWVKAHKGDQASLRAKKAEALTKIEVLKQIAVAGKISQAIEWVENFLEEDGKLVLFAVHKETISALYSHFKHLAVKVDGSTPNVQRNEAREQFQNNPDIRLFIGNIQSAGEGLTLTASSNVAFLELPWTPGDVTQAEDRCHRYGQKNAVNVYFLLAYGTIEEKIAELLSKKKDILGRTVDGTESPDLVWDLIQNWKKEGLAA